MWCGIYGPVLRRNIKRTYTKNNLKGIRKAGWDGDVENVIRKMGIVNCRKVAQDRVGGGNYRSWVVESLEEEEEERSPFSVS